MFGRETWLQGNFHYVSSDRVPFFAWTDVPAFFVLFPRDSGTKTCFQYPTDHFTIFEPIIDKY